MTSLEKVLNTARDRVGELGGSVGRRSRCFMFKATEDLPATFDSGRHLAVWPLLTLLEDRAAEQPLRAGEVPVMGEDTGEVATDFGKCVRGDGSAVRGRSQCLVVGARSALCVSYAVQHVSQINPHVAIFQRHKAIYTLRQIEQRPRFLPDPLAGLRSGWERSTAFYARIVHRVPDTCNALQAGLVQNLVQGGTKTK